MREEDIAHKHRERVSPFGIERGTVAATVGTIHDVVMHQTSDMDQFQNHGEIDMIGNDATGSATREERQRRTEALPTAADGILDIMLDTGIDRF